MTDARPSFAILVAISAIGPLALNIFKGLRGADQSVIAQFRDLVIGDNSYALRQWQAADLKNFADAAMGSGNWPAGTNT